MKRVISAATLLAFLLVMALPAMAQDMKNDDPVPAYTPPAVVDASPVQLPSITKKVLKNGLTVYFIPQKEVPLVSFQLKFPTGSLYNPNDKPGLTDMMAELLTKGTTKRSATEFAETIDFIGAYLATGAGNNTTYILADVMSHDIELALDMISDIVMNPTFPEEELEREKMLTISSLMASKDDPDAIASRAWAKWVYGEHPYGYSSSGTIESVQQLTRDDIIAQQKRLLIPNNAIFAITGDFDLKKAQKLVNKYFAKWEKGEIPAPTAEPVQIGEGGKVLLVDKPDAVQTQIRMGYILGPYYMGEDHFTFKLMDYLFGGGGFSSRLMIRVRNELGLTYGIYSSLDPRQQNGAYTIETSTQTAKTEEMIDEIYAMFDTVLNDGFTQEELDEAKAFLIGSYPRQFETPAQIAKRFQTLLLFDFGDPDQYIAQYRQNVADVTLEQVNAMAKKYLQKENVRITVVGQASEIGEVMTKYGDVETASVDEF